MVWFYYDDNDDDFQTTGGIPKYSFCLEKKYTPVNLLSGDAEKCYTRQKVFPVDDRTSAAFVTEGVYVYTTTFGVETGLLSGTLNLCTEPVIVPVGLISSSYTFQLNYIL